MGEFAGAACRYWLGVFPDLKRELAFWRCRASAIPDQCLRRFALRSLQAKAGSVEGAAAFAAFTEQARRPAVIRAIVAYQTAFDYLDVLAEQPSEDPISNGRQLHRALLAAVDPRATHIDYYAYHPQRDDAGYLRAILDACRAALASLPSHELTIAPLRGASARIVAYQSYNHGDASGSHLAFEEWARGEACSYVDPTNFEFRWWELAAAAGSSMPVFALVAAAADSSLNEHDVVALQKVYYPTVCALNSLLDSLVDQQEDFAPRQNRLLDYYHSLQEALNRLQAMAARAMADAQTLPRSGGHTIILAALIGFYLSPLKAILPMDCQDRFLKIIGDLAVPTMLVFRAKNAITAGPSGGLLVS